MSDADVWNDESRGDLRESLQTYIRGHVRLAKQEGATILQGCREIYLDDICPESELADFLQFAAQELQLSQSRLAAEQSEWPAVTDCDRLDRVESALRDRGIVLWQASPCCDSCSFSELGDRIAVIDGRYPGFEKRLRGYAFFIDQNLPEYLSEKSEVTVYLAYGWFSSDGEDVAADIYQSHALGIGREVCDCLKSEGLEYTWDGTLNSKIRLPVNWQRREQLT